jgi:hypothetical protein
MMFYDKWFRSAKERALAVPRPGGCCFLYDKDRPQDRQLLRRVVQSYGPKLCNSDLIMIAEGWRFLEMFWDKQVFIHPRA